MNTSGSIAFSEEDVCGALESVLSAFDGAPRGDDFGGMTDQSVMVALSLAESIGRKADALKLAAAAEASERSRSSLGSDGLAARKGCRNANELIRRVTRASVATISKRISLGEAVRVRTSLTGFDGPPRFASVASSLWNGELGVDSATAIVRGLSSVEGRGTPEAWLAAERELVGAATGASGDAPPCGADETRIHAAVWRSILDPDGIEPSEDRAFARRGLRLGREADGLVHFSGMLVASAGAQLQKIIDAYMNPRVAGEGPDVYARETSSNLPSSNERIANERTPDRPNCDDRTHDDRTPNQKRHDLFVSLIDHAARCAETPTLGGSAPAVIVTVDSAELISSLNESVTESVTDSSSAGAGAGAGAGVGAGFVEGSLTPVSARAIRQYACARGIQRVILGDDGQVLELGSPQRCFTSQQRRVIGVRDGGCVIPSCGIPVSWCEVHHVREHARGGPTHTDNGVLLCWFHHRTIDESGWQIRMDRGSPEVKAPDWIDPRARWRKTGSALSRNHARRKSQVRFRPGSDQTPDSGRPRGDEHQSESCTDASSERGDL